MKNKIEDLRNHLFETIEMLKDGDENSMTIEKAKMICQVSERIVDTVKVEISYLQVASEMVGASEFIPVKQISQ